MRAARPSSQTHHRCLHAQRCVSLLCSIAPANHLNFKQFCSTLSIPSLAHDFLCTLLPTDRQTLTICCEEGCIMSNLHSTEDTDTDRHTSQRAHSAQTDSHYVEEGSITSTLHSTTVRPNTEGHTAQTDSHHAEEECVVNTLHSTQTQHN